MLKVTGIGKIKAITSIVKFFWSRKSFSYYVEAVTVEKEKAKDVLAIIVSKVVGEHCIYV